MTTATTVKLNDPITFGSEIIAELTIQQPKAKHFKGLSLKMDSFSDMLDFTGRLSGQPNAVIEELSFQDMQAVFAGLESFLQTGQATGKTPSV